MNVLLQFYPGDLLVLIVTSVLIQVTAITAIALLIARCFASRRPDISHGVLVCALVCCMLSPVVTAGFDWAGVQILQYQIAGSSERSPASVKGAQGFGSANVEDTGKSLPTEDLGETQLMAPASRHGQPNGVSVGLDIFRVFGGAAPLTYFLVGFVLSIRLIRGFRFIYRLRRDSQPLTEDRFSSTLDSVMTSLAMTRAPELACSPKAPGPITFGIFRPFVLIPQVLVDSVDTRQLQHLLLHECAHVQRRDRLTGMIQRLAEILYWPHPLIHLLNGELAEAREQLCDNHVLLNSEPNEYGRTLFEVAEKLRPSPQITATVGLLSRHENLQQRIEKILDARRTLMTRMRHSLSVGIAIGFLSLIVVAAGTRMTDAQDAAVETKQRQAKRFDDSKLDETQRLYRDWTNDRFRSSLDDSTYQQLTDAQRATLESEWIKLVAEGKGRERIPAMNGLAAIRSRKAVDVLSRVAFERAEKDNRDRWMAVRALGILGDDSVVPELIHLTYHYNLNTRFWAQISLVRLTGQNFGRDVDAWRQWWNESGKQPAVSDEVIVWTTRNEWSDPEEMAKTEKKWLAATKGGDGPRIVSTSPKVGATDVDPSTTEITVTFDRDMAGGFSWTGGGEKFPPSPEGKNAVWRDKRTCVLPVKLESARLYRVGINSTSFKNFRSVSGVPVKVSAIYFTTAGASDEVKSRTKKPNIVKMQPKNGTNDVDPRLAELKVTFDVAMGEGFSWTGGGENFPKIPDGKRPHWSKDRKTCVLPVELKPNWAYRMGLNSRSHKNFQSEGGIPLDPVVFTFKTREE